MSNKKEKYEQFEKLKGQGYTVTEIANQLDMSRGTISGWYHGKVDKNKLKGLPKFKIDNADFINFVKESFSIREVLIKCGLHPVGGNYRVFKQRVKDLNLNTSHFTGCGHGKGNHLTAIANEIPIEKAFVKGGKLTSYGLGKKILKYKLKEYKCSSCGIDEWIGKKLSLHLDHIDGDNTNNELENLRFLCPNCHSQTKTYCGKNKNKSITK